MAPIRIIAKCTVIPPGSFLSGPYVIYFYFINIRSTSNLDKCGMFQLHPVQDSCTTAQAQGFVVAVLT